MEKELRTQIQELEQSLPPLTQEQAEKLELASRELALSGITERVLKQGEAAPDFTLPNPVGTPVSLSAALKNGPVVVTFYRGMW